jgi:hypothetical protein
MTTDGYYNSFSTTEGFHKVGSDLIQMLREEDGFGAVNRSVKSWLEEATAAGSGDDCTLAIICRMDALKASSPSSATAAATASPVTETPATHAPAVSNEQPATPKTA